MAEDPPNEQPPPLSRLRPPRGAVQSRQRKGRGPGSGLGKRAGRGQKGQKVRHPGRFHKLGFEGGQIPLQRRLPKIGFRNVFGKKLGVVNVGSLSRFEARSTVDPDTLVRAGLAKRKHDGVKILGEGELDRPLTVRAHAFSASARSKIEQAGGKAELIQPS